MNPSGSTTLPSKLDISGVIFDFDGVLVDSLPAHLEAWKIATMNLFSSQINQAERFIGLSTQRIANIIVSEVSSPENAALLIAEKSRILLDEEVKIPLLPGSIEILEALEKLSIPFGIASNAPKEFILKVLSGHKLRVDVIFGRGEGGRNKPHPDVFLRCAKELHLNIMEQRNTIIFEDSKHGLAAAVKSNMFPIGICSQHTSEDLLQAGANLTFKNLAEFIRTVTLQKLVGSQ